MGLGCIWQGFLIHSDWIKVAHLILLGNIVNPATILHQGSFTFIYTVMFTTWKKIIFSDHIIKIMNTSNTYKQNCKSWTQQIFLLKEMT